MHGGHKLNRLLIALTGVLVFLSAYSLYPVLAAPPTTPYAPGETTNPSCAPGDPNCSVYPPLSTTITTSTSVTLNTSTLNFGSGLFYLDGANNLLGVGTTTPAAKLHIVTTTEQLRLGYSAAAYTFFTIGSNGALTVSSTGGATTTLSNALIVAGAADWRGTILNTTGDLAIGDNVVITGNATTTGNLQISGLSTLATTTITSSTITTANLTTANIGTLTLTGNSSGINISHLTGSTTLVYLSGNQTLSGLNIFTATTTLATTTQTSSTITTANIATLNVTTGLTLPSNTVSSTHLISSGVTSGSYGSGSAVPTITIDADGRITSASTSSIAINTSSISGIFAPASGGTGTSTFSSGGLIFSNGAILTQNPGSLYWDSSNSRLGLGTAVPSTTLHSLSTTEQLRLGYDASNYTSFTVGSSGALTITPSGSATTTVSNALAISGAASLASTLGVTGHTTLSTVSSTNATFSGTLLVSGTSTFATTTQTSSTITTANIATLNVTSGLTLPSNTVSSSHLISSGVTSGSYGSGSAVPTITIDEDGRITSASTSSIAINTSSISGIFAVTNGGTGSSTIGSAGAVAYSNGTYYTFTAVGDSGQVLQSQGTGAPVWVSTSSLGISSMPAGTSAQTLRHDGSNWVATSFLVNDGAKIGINTATPSTTLHIVSSTEQLRLGYDASNYTKFTIASDGQFTIAPTNFATTTINSALLVATGTEALPSLSFKNDPNTGIWNPSADTIRMSFGGTSNINFTSGVVAANTHQTYDNVSIVIKGYDGNDSSAIGVILNNNTELTTAGGKLVSIQNAGNEKAYIDKDGGAYFGSAVGIATSTPGARLHVVSSTEQLRLGYDAGNYVKFTVASNGSLTVTSTGGATTTIGGQGLVLASQTAYPTGPTAGQMFYSSTSNTMYLYNGTSWVDMATTTGGGGSANMYSATSSVASGSYVEVAHNQSTTNLITSGWVYNSTTGQWRQVAADLNAIGTHTTGDTNLKGWWKMEESSGVLADQTSNGHTFQTGASSTPTYAQVGKIDQTLSFDGINDFFYATSTSALQPTSSISIGGWVQFPEAFAANTHYQDFAVLDKGDYKLGFDRGTGKLKFELNSTSSPAWATSYNGAQERFQSLAVYNSKLYAGQAADVGDSDVYVYGGSPTNTSWAVSYNGSQEYIFSLATYKGKLYAGQGVDTGDSDIFEFDGTTWSTSYDGAQEEIYALGVYNGKLYAGMGVGTGDGDVLVFDGTTWSTSYDGAQERITSFAVYNGKLYAGQGYDGAGDGDVLVCNPAAAGDANTCDNASDWSISYDGSVIQIMSLAVYNGKLYAGQYATGDADILVFDGTTWSTSYNGAQNGIFSLGVYNGKLYAGQGDATGAGDVLVCNPATAGDVNMCDNASDWSTSYDGAQEAIITQASHNGKLYVGQGYNNPDGDVFVFGNNQVLASARSTWDPGRWYHVVGTYNGSTMSVYVNGKLESAVSTTLTINTGTTTLYLGSDGSSNLFKGKMDEPFVYNDALTSAEIATLYGNNDEDYRIIQTDNNTLRLYNYSGASQTLGLNAIAAAAATGTGAILSDRNLKDNFLTVDPQDILNKVNQLSIMQWNYKSDNPEVKHLGPFAQDFRAAFGLGNSDTTISIIDTVGVSLLSIQSLSQNMANLASSTASSVLRLENRLNLAEINLASSTQALQNNILTLASDMASSTANLQNQYLALNNQYLNLNNQLSLLQTEVVSSTGGWQNALAAMQGQLDQKISNIQYSISSSTASTATAAGLFIRLDENGQLLFDPQNSTARIVFDNEVALRKHVAAGEDVAGQAKILAGHTSTTVLFAQPYIFAPVITVTPINYVGTWKLTDVTTSGFRILIIDNIPISQYPNIQYPTLFNWLAVASVGGKVFVSDGTVQDVNAIVNENPNDQMTTTSDSLSAASSVSSSIELIDPTTALASTTLSTTSSTTAEPENNAPSAKTTETASAVSNEQGISAPLSLPASPAEPPPSPASGTSSAPVGETEE